jgi:hypothetical protein
MALGLTLTIMPAVGALMMSMMVVALSALGFHENEEHFDYGINSVRVGGDEFGIDKRPKEHDHRFDGDYYEFYVETRERNCVLKLTPTKILVRETEVIRDEERKPYLRRKRRCATSVSWLLVPWPVCGNTGHELHVPSNTVIQDFTCNSGG